MEAIDRMSADERVKTVEYLRAEMTATMEPESPARYGNILAVRRSRVESGQESFISIEGAMRQLREKIVVWRG